MSILDDATVRLREAGVESPRSEARLLLAYAMGVSREDIISGAITPDAAALARFDTAIARRSRREPFAYIVGRREFFSRDFEVGAGVLIPRPETELLVEEALRRFPRDEELRVLDLGTGTGCLLLSFLCERSLAEGVGVDESEAAIAWARRNADRLGLGRRAQFIRGNWSESVAARFDVIFVNPPYIETGDILTLAPEVAAHEPASAIDGGKDGLEAYRQIAPTLTELLTEKGFASVEIGEGQGEAVLSIFEKSKLFIEVMLTDLGRILR